VNLVLINEYFYLNRYIQEIKQHGKDIKIIVFLFVVVIIEPLMT